MSLDAKVIEYVGRIYNKNAVPKDRVVIELPIQPEYDGSPMPESITIAHDYVRFHGTVSIQQQENEKGEYPIKETRGARNWIYAHGCITIGIRDMYDIILPMLNKHKHLQSEHFKTRVGDGEAYEPYCYEGCILNYYDEKINRYMVTFRRTGDTVWETMTQDLFNTIKHTLKLNHSKLEMESIANKSKV